MLIKVNHCKENYLGQGANIWNSSESRSSVKTTTQREQLNIALGTVFVSKVVYTIPDWLQSIVTTGPASVFRHDHLYAIMCPHE